MRSKEEIYVLLVARCKEVPFRYDRYGMVSYCVGRLKKVDETIWECIEQLYTDGFIDS